MAIIQGDPNEVSETRCVPLSIPDLSRCSTLLNAALAWVQAGWFVLPTDPKEIKNPGSVVKGKWHEKSSRDPEQIRKWWTQNPNYGIALHVGRSGAIAFDLDKDRADSLPPLLWTALKPGRFQRTRPAPSVRGHYVFATEPGESFGNSAGAFMMYGEVRGKNGVIITETTPHPDAVTKNGCYHWESPGPLAPMTDELRGIVSAAADHADPMTSVELTIFLKKHNGDERPYALAGQLTAFRKAVRQGVSRHETMTAILPWAFREAIIKCYPARRAYEELKTAFKIAKPEAAPGEFDRMAAWAAAQAELADPDETRGRLDREPPEIDEEEFWNSRVILADLRQFARARRVGPWGMLGNVLTLVVSAIPPHVVLPPEVGSVASLNLFIALVGESGRTKSTSMSAAQEWLSVDPQPKPTKPATGEGLANLFADVRKINGVSSQIGLEWSVLARIPEVETLTKTGARSGSTIMSELRSGFSGERLGHDYRSANRITVCDHRYRLAMTVGVQPHLAKPLLDDAGVGTPQRFVWLPVNDPGAPKKRPKPPLCKKLPAWPNPLTKASVSGKVTMIIDPVALLDQPTDSAGLDVLRIPEAAQKTIDDQAFLALSDDVKINRLDSHRLLCQLKVAAALMALDQRYREITDGDWELAQIVMEKSLQARNLIQSKISEKTEIVNVAKGKAEGKRAYAAEEARFALDVKRVSNKIIECLEDAC